MDYAKEDVEEEHVGCQEAHCHGQAGEKRARDEHRPTGKSTAQETHQGAGQIEEGHKERDWPRSLLSTRREGLDDAVVEDSCYPDAQLGHKQHQAAEGQYHPAPRRVDPVGWVLLEELGRICHLVFSPASFQETFVRAVVSLGSGRVTSQPLDAEVQTSRLQTESETAVAPSRCG